MYSFKRTTSPEVNERTMPGSGKWMELLKWSATKFSIQCTKWWLEVTEIILLGLVNTRTVIDEVHPTSDEKSRWLINIWLPWPKQSNTNQSNKQNKTTTTKIRKHTTWLKHRRKSPHWHLISDHLELEEGTEALFLNSFLSLYDDHLSTTFTTHWFNSCAFLGPSRWTLMSMSWCSVVRMFLSPVQIRFWVLTLFSTSAVCTGRVTAHFVSFRMFGKSVLWNAAICL